jgi:hypothetical protein
MADRPSSVAAAKRAGSKYFWDKKGVKKLAVTAEELKASGLTLREWANGKKKSPVPKAKNIMAKKGTPAAKKAVAQRKSDARPARKHSTTTTTAKAPAKPRGKLAAKSPGVAKTTVTKPMQANLARTDARRAKERKGGGKSGLARIASWLKGKKRTGGSGQMKRSIASRK